MNTIRTPKAGETWIWMPCDKHGYRQLRDVVYCGRDFEDQPEFAQRKIMENLVCGCQYAADDPGRAILALRAHEYQHEADFRLKVAEIEARAYLPEPLEVSPWWAVAVILVAMGTAMYFVIH